MQILSFLSLLSVRISYLLVSKVNIKKLQRLNHKYTTFIILWFYMMLYKFFLLRR